MGHESRDDESRNDESGDDESGDDEFASDDSRVDPRRHDETDSTADQDATEEDVEEVRQRPDDSSSTVDLISRAHKGEKHALGELFARYYHRVQNVVRRNLGQGLRRHLESGDIVQGTFAQAADGFDRFERHDNHSLLNWLSMIAMRKILEALDYYSAAKRDPRKEVAMDHAVPCNEKTPSEILADREQQDLLRKSLDQLPEKYRVTIVLRCFGQLSYEDIAAETNRPSADAARMYYKKSIRELEKVIRQHSA